MRRTAAERRAEILQAAVQAFAANGYAATTTPRSRGWPASRSRTSSACSARSNNCSWPYCDQSATGCSRPSAPPARSRPRTASAAAARHSRPKFSSSLARLLGHQRRSSHRRDRPRPLRPYLPADPRPHRRVTGTSQSDPAHRRSARRHDRRGTSVLGNAAPRWTQLTGCWLLSSMALISCDVRDQMLG